MGTKANWSGGYGRNRHFAKNLHQPPPGDQSWEGDLPASADQERRQVAFSVGDRVAHEDDGQGQVIDVLGVPRTGSLSSSTAASRRPTPRGIPSATRSRRGLSWSSG